MTRGGRALARLGTAQDQRHRPRMEDRAVVGKVADGLLAAVFDGHGGPEVADRAAAQALVAVSDGLEAALSGEALWGRVFLRLDAPRAASGATATLVLVRGDGLSVAWVGDSRAILVGREASQPLTRDHRIDRPDERRRVLAAGAVLHPPYAVDPATGQGLMVTRALGDHGLRHIGIIPDPETASVGLGPDHLGFVLATDGLWDLVSEPEAAAACREEDAQGAAERLVRLVVARGGRDNVTVIVGRFGGSGAGSIDSTATID